MGFREVFKAKHQETGVKVALKKVLMENEREGVILSITIQFHIHYYTVCKGRGKTIVVCVC